LKGIQLSEPLHSAPELLRLAASSAISPEEFERQLGALSKGHQRIARQYKGGDVRIYRSTNWPRIPTTNSAAIELERPKSVADLSYPPKHVTPLNRANLAGEPVFYASAGLPLSFVESRLKKGQYVVCAEWRNTLNLLLQEVGLSAGGIMSDVERIYHEIFTSTDPAMYRFSARVARHLLDFGNPVSGLIYPSIAAQNDSQNVALKTMFVDTGLRFVNASLYYVKDVTGPFRYEVEEMDFAIPSRDGSLDWKGRKRQWVLRKQGDELKIVSDGWALNAYDVAGALVDPE
jgi:hypothetical protein